MKTILLVTYDISPYRGSEASVGWNYVSNMQHTNRLIVLYGKGQTEIESYLRTNTMPHVRFQNIAYTEIDGHGLINDIKYNLNYRKWHKRVTDAATKILAEEPVDVIHYLNPIGFKEPRIPVATSAALCMGAYPRSGKPADRIIQGLVCKRKDKRNNTQDSP